MTWLQQFFQRYSELAVYLSLGIGFAIGTIKMRGLGRVARRIGAIVSPSDVSDFRVLGDSGSVAIAHVLLPMWGSVIVWLIAGDAPPQG